MLDYCQELTIYLSAERRKGRRLELVYSCPPVLLTSRLREADDTFAATATPKRYACPGARERARILMLFSLPLLVSTLRPSSHAEGSSAVMPRRRPAPSIQEDFCLSYRARFPLSAMSNIY